MTRCMLIYAFDLSRIDNSRSLVLIDESVFVRGNLNAIFRAPGVHD